MFDNQIGDHIHPLGISQTGQLEPATTFDYSEIDRRLGWLENTDDKVSMSDAAAALSLVLGWMIGYREKNPRSLAMIGACALSLQFFLDPTNCRSQSLAEIAQEAGCTRAALSAILLRLRNQLGMMWQLDKKQISRETYAAAQHAAYRDGVHAAQIMRQKKVAPAGTESKS